MSDRTLLNQTLIVLFILLTYGILTLWVAEPLALGIFQAGTLLIGLVWALWIVFLTTPLVFAPALIPLAAAALWPAMQLVANRTVYRWTTWESLWNWIVNFVVFFLVLQVTSDPNRLRRFLRMILYFAFALSAISVIQMFTSAGNIFWIFPSGYTDFVLGPFVYRNQYAAFIELTLPIALYFSIFSKSNRVGYAAMAAVMVASVVASAARAGMVLVLGEIVAVPLAAVALGLVSRQAAVVVLGKTLVFALLFALVVGLGTVWTRFFSPDPYFLRREVLVSAYQMVRDRPGLGFGLGTWKTAYPSYAIFDPGAVINQAHNDWAQWAVEGGIPFAVLMLGVAALLFRPAVRSIWGIGVLAVLVHA